MALALLAPLTASADPSLDPLHGGQGAGVKVVGHTDLADPVFGRGLNGQVAVLGDHAYVGTGTNGGFASQWNKTPTCKDAGGTPTSVKVVSLVDRANPTVVARIPIADDTTMARDLATLRVEHRSSANDAFTGDLLAVALESCNASATGNVGVYFYDISNPATPVLLGHDNRFRGNVATRGVSLVQRPDGRVLVLEANQGSGGGVHVVDATNPTAPQTLAVFPQSQFSPLSQRECRPFNYVNGAAPDATGSRAYVAYGDAGLYVLDISGAAPTVVGQASYPSTDEGNSFRFVPNAGASVAVATDEDLNPASTTLSVASGSAALVTEPGGTAAGVFRGCEALWGAPLYEQATPSIAADIQFAAFGCNPADYAAGFAGKIALTQRGGTSFDNPAGACSFDEKARRAQAAGARAVLIANTVIDHHGAGSGVLFSADSVRAGDAGVSIPVVMITKEAGDAIRSALATESVTATLADSPGTWGALRVFDLSGAAPVQVSTFNAPHTATLTPGDGRYHAVNTVWDGSNALVAWMSDGLRVVDITTPAAPKGRAYYVPPAASDPTGNYGTVPLVVGVERLGADSVVITDVNGGLYVLNVVRSKSQCYDGGFAMFGFRNQGSCVNFFDDDPQP